ncbi:cysteine hydrolase [Tsukamurella sp. 8F]|uniref:cysteine hydrolase family protein n=1 Tax=unclassified Tsukamurella TaxID=2633480 RepID=UPI0023B94229|nr:MULTISPECIES: isochorismatase family cysteine hydrolase [unclassified Tsukamurella]MDF0528959.1 cysteine hydrolase [Tsukamurella sp. 8J]MDF0587332.1 cysteine hydrolase [Tsukamurella sp. 8F]
MTTAVLIIDMQNGFVHPRGSLPSAGRGLPYMEAVTAANVALIAAARERSVPVIYTRHVYRADRVDLPRMVADSLPLHPPALLRGSWDAAVIDELAPEPGDTIVDKNRYDAFLYTDLEVVLRARGISRLVVGGVVTSVCVESTVRSGQQRDFDMYVAADATSAPIAQHQPALDMMATLFAAVGPGSQMLEWALEGRLPTVPVAAG